MSRRLGKLFGLLDPEGRLVQGICAEGMEHLAFDATEVKSLLRAMEKVDPHADLSAVRALKKAGYKFIEVELTEKKRRPYDP